MDRSGSYTIAGYNKQKKKHIVYAEMTSFDDAVNEAKMLGMSCRKGELKEMGGEPVDWIEIVSDYKSADQRIVWASYDLCVKSCANN